MAKKKVVDYISEQLQNGYNISQIKNVMLQYGYDNSEIDEAVNEIYHPSAKREIKFSTAIISFLIVAALAGTFFFFYFGDDQSVEHNEPKSIAVKPPEKPKFEEQPTEKQTEKQETCFDQIKNQDEEEADCGGACQPCEKKSDCNDNNQCTFDFDENGKCVNRPLTTCCGNNICEQNEQLSCSIDCKPADSTSNKDLERIEETAKTDPGKALEECSKIEFSDTRDTCISNVAEAQQDKEQCSVITSASIKDKCYQDIAKLLRDNSICEQVSTESRRDSCYSYFFIDYKDFSVCSKLMNKALRQSCESLKQLSAVSQQVPQS